MRKYASLSWKRTWVWATTPLIASLDLGAMTPQERLGSKTLTTRYKDSKGRTRFKGNKSLKTSQYLFLIRMFVVYGLFSQKSFTNFGTMLIFCLSCCHCSHAAKAVHLQIRCQNGVLGSEGKSCCSSTRARKGEGVVETLTTYKNPREIVLMAWGTLHTDNGLKTYG